MVTGLVKNATFGMDSVFVPFVQGTTFLSAAGAAQGWEIDADTEYAVAFWRVPSWVTNVFSFKVVGNSVIAEAHGMQLLITVNGGAANEVYNTEVVSVTKTSTTLNFAVTDFVEWDFVAADDADVDDFVPGDILMIKINHAATAGDNIATDCIFQGVEIVYV
jgi:hypothetical protein